MRVLPYLRLSVKGFFSSLLVLKLEYALESPGRLDTVRIAEFPPPNSRVSDTIGLCRGPRICILNKFPFEPDPWTTL